MHLLGLYLAGIATVYVPMAVTTTAYMLRVLAHSDRPLTAARLFGALAIVAFCPLALTLIVLDPKA